jgi:general secretion pathway protein G
MAFRSRKRRAFGARGVTLFEVLIVVAILALVAGGVGVAAMTYLDRAKQRMAESNARAIRASLKTWWIEHSRDECPAVDDLIASGGLDRDSPRSDPWGEAWRVECSEEDATVVSAGRDRKLGTSDDIRVPPA